MAKKICPETFAPSPAPSLNIKEFQALKIKLGKGGIAIFKDFKFTTNGIYVGSVEMGEGSTVK